MLRPLRLGSLAPALAIGLALAACGSDVRTTIGSPFRASPTPPSDGSGDTGADQEQPAEELPGFAVPRDQPMLLPFWVRLERVARTLDLPTTDAVFSPLVANRLRLGDYDHAHGVPPDPLWSPAKMTLWIEGLRPVCAHPNMKARHEWLVADLMRDAWGRDPSIAEVEAFRAELDAAGVVGADRDQAACLAILSSLEVVAQ
jgi:hypothetical protein